MDPKDLNLPGGCKNKGEFLKYLLRKISECKGENKSKEETENHLLEKFQIERKHTSILWNRVQEMNPELLKDVWKEAGEEEEETRVDPLIDFTESDFPGCCKSKAEFLAYEEIHQLQSLISLSLLCFRFHHVNLYALFQMKKHFTDCMREKKSKEVTEKHLLEKFQIGTKYTRKLWNILVKQTEEALSKFGKRTGESSNPTDLNLLGGFKSRAEYVDYLIDRINECKGENKSKEDTANHLWEKFQIKPVDTRSVWDHLETWNLPGGSKSRTEYSVYIVKKINECIGANKSKEETAKHLWENFKIQTKHTIIIWDRLEEQNLMKKNLPDGCKSMGDLAVYITLKIKESVEGEEKKTRMGEVMDHLSENFKIDPRYTEKCLLHLAAGNRDLSSSLLTDLGKIYEQIETEKKTSEQVTAPPQVTQVDLTEAGPSTRNREEQISSDENLYDSDVDLSSMESRTQNLVGDVQKEFEEFCDTSGSKIFGYESFLPGTEAGQDWEEQRGHDEKRQKLMNDAAESGEKQPGQEGGGDKDEETENLQDQNQQETQRLDSGEETSGSESTNREWIKPGSEDNSE